MGIKLKIDEELLFNLWKEIEESTNIRLTINSFKGGNISVTLNCQSVPRALCWYRFHLLEVDLYVVGAHGNTIVLGYRVVNPFSLDERVIVDHIKNNTTHDELEILTEEKEVLVHLDGFRMMKKILNVALPRGLIFNNGDVELDMILT